MSAKRYLGLDGLRGVAALTAMLFHCNGIFHKGAFFQHGFMAVDLFFMLSGFVVALCYEERLAIRLSAGGFLKIRARRLMPTFWLGTGFCAICFIVCLPWSYEPASWGIALATIPMTLLLVPQYMIAGEAYPVSSVAWSLGAEWLVNIFYAVLAFRLRTRTLIAITAAGFAAMTWVGFSSGTGWCVGTRISEFPVIAFVRAMPSFTAGIVLFRVHRMEWVSRLPVVSTELLLIVWLAAAVIPTFTATPLIDAEIAILLCPLLIMLTIRSEHTAPSWCKIVGDLSYPLYASHLGLLRLATFIPLFGLNRGPNPAMGFVVVVLAIAVAWLVMRVVAPGSPRIEEVVAARAADFQTESRTVIPAKAGT
jgi:peptidoglycan/LPS O-acetylase OafA/YrhL